MLATKSFPLFLGAQRTWYIDNAHMPLAIEQCHRFLDERDTPAHRKLGLLPGDARIVIGFVFVTMQASCTENTETSCL